jgi:hypothetical protein
MSSESVSVFAKLKEHGLLLQTDANLANVCALIAGAPVRGSWWAHPRNHEIFRMTCELCSPRQSINLLIACRHCSLSVRFVVSTAFADITVLLKAQG